MVLTRSALRRVERVAERDLDDRALRIELLRVLRDAVPFEDYAWLLTDPVTTVGSAPLADVRCLPELPRLIGLRYRTTVNRWTTLDAADSLLHATGGEPERSLVWRDLQQQHGVGDVATVAFRDGFGLWGWVDLWRSSGADPFSDAEVGFLADVSRPITTALRRTQARYFAEPAPLAVPDGLAVLMLSTDLEVVGQTPHTTEYLRLLVPTPAGQSPIPAGAFNVAAQLLAVEAGVDDHPPSSRVHLGGGRWVTLRADRIGAEGPGAGTIAVTIELTSPADRLDVFTRAAGLSPREAELVGLVVDGHDSTEIAARMFLSPHTVQDHLKSVFAKTSTRSRRALVSLVRGR
ncbi:MAG TPA: helix-turn-helix transcriptional regulator [Lapillicoccus sp.]|nr:helix-turn-helix transcriptional regulator [Lapillicoccus sp.]